ncbi:Coenzyme F420 hydrogenase/dehydrogenase, beta subunit C-terminal domain [Microbacterium sp. MC2]
MSDLRTRVRRVVQADACSGCGMCTLLDRGLEMSLESGYLRPKPVSDPDQLDGAAKIFDRACPGRRMDAQRPEGARRHPLLGSYFGMWVAWATDETARHGGSSGGALTALHQWLLDQDIDTRIVSAAASRTNPSRTVPVTITTREAALASGGSRYAPVAVAGSPEILASPTAVTGKPCEISALRAAELSEDAPLLLSFFCAGTPSQQATEKLVRDLGGPPMDEITALRYRGEGWPGRFVASFDGGEVSTDYENSWGSTLGPATQWRCKICPDGIGESADVVAADSWDTDERGYPVFDEGAGQSALIARTPRGLAAVLAAEAAGFLQLKELAPAALAAAQPLQVNRRTFLFARMVGSIVAGRPTPRYGGFGLMRLSLSAPRTALRTARGTFQRVRAVLRPKKIQSEKKVRARG